MQTVPAIYCSTCHVMQGIREWHEREDALVIELEPCGHVMVRSARVEWLARGVAAA